MNLNGLRNKAEKLWEEEKGYIIAVALALFVVSGLLANYYFTYRPIPEGYSTISLLDSDKKAINYPDVVTSQNSTFNVWVVVTNHMGGTVDYKIQQKIVDRVASLPINAVPVSTYQKNLQDGETWETQAAVTLTEPGNYAVAFELWQFNAETNSYEFKNYNLCILNIVVIS